jgi:hypothetical protein
LAAQLNLDYRRLMGLAGYQAPARRLQPNVLESRFAAASLTEAEERSVAAFIDHLVAQREQRST